LRIAAISVAPLFPNSIFGGSQKILKDVAVGLNRIGHDVQLWCTRTRKHTRQFEMNGITVHPDLRLRGTFPATHQVSPIDLATTAKVLSGAGSWAQRIYLHADAIYMRHALENCEIVRSIHDFTYEEALISALTLPADLTIVPSDYLKRCIEATVAISGRKMVEPIVAVPNGIQVPETIPPPWLPPELRSREDSDLILLFPHRPILSKGVSEAIQTAVLVQQLIPTRKVRLLMPAYPSDAALDNMADTVSQIQELSRDFHAQEIVELHRWIGPEEISSYYAAGDVTLCLGSFVESFGLTPIESVAHGTPAICARVGAFRNFTDIDGIAHVAYGHIPSAAECVVQALDLPETSLTAGKRKIAAQYSLESMIAGYESAITKPLIGQRSVMLERDDYLCLAPWCDLQEQFIFSDYSGEAGFYPELTGLLSTDNERVRSKLPGNNPRLELEIQAAQEFGLLIPSYHIE
tara:strand:- start:1514 stop:2905 length:1392 start_codon:yes stop_codon:yes gene_type:complete